jgi:hypothetical protein
MTLFFQCLPDQHFVFFFGPTPASQEDAPRAYSPVNVFGRILGDPKVFKTVPEGARIQVDRADR